MKRRQDVLVKCPYYKGEEAQKICCEGVQDGSSIHLAFDTKPNLRQYKTQLCKGAWGKCFIADMLNRKYDYR